MPCRSFAAGSIQDDSEPQQSDSVYVPEAVVATDEPVIEDTPVASSQDSISVPLRWSSHSAQPPKREMEGC